MICNVGLKLIKSSPTNGYKSNQILILANSSRISSLVKVIELIPEISIICSSSCDPIDDKRGTIEFRSHVAGVLAKRAIILAHSRAGDKIEKIAR